MTIASRQKNVNREEPENDQADGRDGRDLTGGIGPIDQVAEFLLDYIALTEASAIVIAAWVAAAWLSDVWDRFPHLAITSPEKRCGKTTLLDILAVIVPRPHFTSNISPAALYRVIERKKPTLLFDEAQSLSRVKSESGEVLKEILNAGIGKNARVTRCGGKNMDELREFSIYSPKVFAMIGEPDGVLADRSLPVPMKRTKYDVVQRVRSRDIESRGREISEKLSAWAEEWAEVAAIYYNDVVQPFDIENDRMADLMQPLQCVLLMNEGNGIDILEKYAASLDERDKQRETQSPGVQLLLACREIYEGETFLTTSDLIDRLVNRTEEPWHRWNRGQPIGPESLAKLLSPFKVKSKHNKARTARGYYACDFVEAWDCYLPERPSNPSNPSLSSKVRA